jgi:hypothetical protein
MGDADITLRHVTRGRAEELARAYLPVGRCFKVLGWIDSQVTRIERRLDKAMRLRVGAQPRILHVEFCFTLDAEVSDRILEYLGFLFTALRAEGPRDPVPPIVAVMAVVHVAHFSFSSAANSGTFASGAG